MMSSETNKIPDRVTLKPDGTYIWSAEMNMDIEKNNNETATKIWIVVAMIIFGVGIVFSIRNHSWTPFLSTAIFAFTILLISSGAENGQKSMGPMRKTYRMTDKIIATGVRRGSTYFEFSKVKVMVVGKRYIDLKGRLEEFRVYIPEEDLDFVRDYIKNRIPPECEIRYE